MTKDLRDAGADAATAAAVDPDQAVELAREYLAAQDRLNTPEEFSDDDADDFASNILDPLANKLRPMRPTSREGVIAILDVVTDERRQQSGEEPPDFFEVILRNARDALKTGVGLAGQAGDEALVALWAKHVALRDDVLDDDVTDVDARDQYTESIADQMTAVEAEILATPATTIAGARVHTALLAWFTIEGVTPDETPDLRRLAGEGGAS